ncbi:MAG: helix-turn-helix domain-containing protein [Limnobacter sp.]|nr:helix-turn-helix domain-containing protein [Limnobacter sp.]
MSNPTAHIQAAVHPVYPRLLCAEMTRRGFRRENILQGSALSWAQLHESNQFLKLQDMAQLTQHCIELTDCPWLGLEVGFKTQAAAHGGLGAAMMASSNLASAILILQKYSQLRQNLATLKIHHTPEFAIELAEQVDLGASREYLMGQLVAGLEQLFMTITGKELQAHVCIEWPFAKPDWAEQYQRVARTNSFGHTRLKVTMDAEMALSPSLAADDENLPRLLQECDLQLNRVLSGGSLSQKIRMQLSQIEGKMPSLENVAEREHLTPRTLMRKLASEGHSFQALLDEVRFERARWLLEHSTTSVEQIACQLGYEDPSNFSRTFKRWAGQTPGQYRSGLKGK